MEGLFKNLNKSTDELLLSATQKDVDEAFDKEKTFLLEYHTAIKDAAGKADRMAKAHKCKSFDMVFYGCIPCKMPNKNSHAFK